MTLYCEEYSNMYPESECDFDGADYESDVESECDFSAANHGASPEEGMWMAMDDFLSEGGARGVGERSSWEEFRFAMRNGYFYMPRPMQLAASVSRFETMEEMKAHHEEELRLFKIKCDKEMAEEQVRETVRRQEEELEMKKVMQSLPKYPKATRERMAREEEEKKKQEAAEAEAEKKRRRKDSGPRGLRFAHKRNGGKRRKAPSSLVVDAKYAQTMAARRAAKRQERKKEKKRASVEVTPRNHFSHRVLPSLLSTVRKVAPSRVWAPESEEEDLLRSLVAIQVAKLPEQERRESENQMRAEAAQKKKEEEEAAAKAEAATWSRVERKSKVKKGPTKIIIATPYKRRPRTDSTRSDGMKKLERPSRDKIKLCRSVTSKKPCPHGDKCRYAHSKEELVRDDCYFAGECRMVTLVDGVWQNKEGKRSCFHLHPNETEENLAARRKARQPEESKPKTETNSESRPKKVNKLHQATKRGWSKPEPRVAVKVEVKVPTHPQPKPEGPQQPRSARRARKDRQKAKKKAARAEEMK